MVAKKEVKETKEGERKSSRTPKVVERLSVSPPTILKKKAATKKTAEPKTTKTTKTKGSKKAKKEGPKRPTSAYFFYMRDNRDRIKKENPDATFGEIGKLLGEAWGDATAAEKKKYNALAEKDKARYEKEKAAVINLFYFFSSFILSIFLLLTFCLQAEK